MISTGIHRLYFIDSAYVDINVNVSSVQYIHIIPQQGIIGNPILIILIFKTIDQINISIGIADSQVKEIRKLIPGIFCIRQDSNGKALIFFRYQILFIKPGYIK